MNRPDPSFEDGTGHVIGHFVTDLPVAGEGGVRPYIYVEGVDDALEKVAADGGEPVLRGNHGGVSNTGAYPAGRGRLAPPVRIARRAVLPCAPRTYMLPAEAAP